MLACTVHVCACVNCTQQAEAEELDLDNPVVVRFLTKIGETYRHRQGGGTGGDGGGSEGATYQSSPGQDPAPLLTEDGEVGASLFQPPGCYSTNQTFRHIIELYIVRLTLRNRNVRVDRGVEVDAA